jgi:hypothetical protein
MVRDANRFHHFEDIVFVLAWTTGDASNMSCQSRYQVNFVYSSMSSGIVMQSKFNSSIIRSGTTEKVGMKLTPWCFSFMSLPCVARRSGASFILCMYRVILETEWMSRLLKLKMNFNVWTNRGLRY